MRQEVKWFAEIMEEQLRRHDKDRGERGWKSDWKMALLRRLLEEVGELAECILMPHPNHTIKECADIANFAMMIADNVKDE